MGAECKMWIQFGPFLCLEASNKLKFYLITFIIHCFLLLSPWPLEVSLPTGFCFQSKLPWESGTIFLKLSFEPPSRSPFCVTDTNICKKQTASLVLTFLVPSAATSVLGHMLL